MGRKLDQLIEIFCCGGRQQKDKRPLPQTRMAALPAHSSPSSVRIPLPPSAVAARKAVRPNALDTSEGWMAAHVIVDRPRGPPHRKPVSGYNTCHAKIDTTPIRIPKQQGVGKVRDDDRAPTNRRMDYPYAKVDDDTPSNSYGYIMPGAWPTERTSKWARTTAV